MKIAVTTASGQLGQAIIGALTKETGKDNVIGIARSPEKAKHLGVEIRKGDYNSGEEFREALRGVDTVLLVSGMDHPDKRIAQHRNVIDAAREAGVQKIVYTSIIGAAGKSSFDAIVRSNRQSEEDIRKSGLQWSIGRNGLYIEPDVEYIGEYKKAGEVANCAGEGHASYTTREELAAAYARMILSPERNGKVFNLCGEAITQAMLTGYLNKTFGTSLSFRNMSPEAYLELQRELNGEFLGTVIAGIYTKILNGEFKVESQFEEAAGRPHVSWEDYFLELKIK